MPRQARRAVTAEDLYRLNVLSGAEISPDGRHVAFTVQRVDRKTEKKYSNLWIAPVPRGAARQFTWGDQTDALPRWSPDGRHIAFLSNRDDEKQPQIYLIPIDGGEARPLTRMQGEFGSFAWSPDGRQLVCAFRKKDAEALEREKDERKKKLGVVERRVTRLFYKLDGYGFLPHERWHLWMIDARTGRARQLTEGDTFDELAPAWSPDGQSIAFLSNHAPDPDLDPDAVDLFVMPAAGGEPRRIETPLGGKELPAFSPDGQWIAYYATEGRGNWWQNTNLWVVPADGSAPARNLTAPFDLHVSASTINDVGAAVQPPPVWSPDSRTLYFQVARHGSTRLYAVDVDGGKPYEIINKPGVVADFSLDRAGQTLACRLGTMTDPGQIWTYPLDGRRPRRHTTFNRAVVRRAEACPIEEVWFKGAAGNDLQGWILKPPNFDPDKTYPSILEIHGGPYTQYGNFFMHEFFFLAGQGYVVYFCNPRGGQGYGEAHAKATWHDQGGADYDDLMCWTDYLAQQPYIDPNRMGVTGGSYGGFMTLWIIGHTDRFKAAVAQRVVSNEISMHGTSDFNWVFQYPMGDKPPWEDLENTWRLSPMKYIGNVKTPTLIIHSEQDHRCPIEQGEQVFVALKQLGVETEMVRFPDEPHGLSRVGRTDRRIARLNHILRWFDKYLKADGS